MSEVSRVPTTVPLVPPDEQPLHERPPAPLLKSLEQRFRQARKQFQNALAAQRLRATAAGVDLAAVAARHAAHPAIDVVVVSTDGAEAGVRRCHLFLRSLRLQHLPPGNVVVVAPADTIAAVREDSGHDTDGGRQLQPRFVAIDDAQSSLLQAIRAALPADGGNFVAVCDASAAWCDDTAIWLACAAAHEPKPRAVYADHVDIGDDERAGAPHHKPHFSWLYLLARNFVEPFVVYDSHLVQTALDRLIARGVSPSQSSGALYAIALEALHDVPRERVLHIRHPLAARERANSDAVRGADLPAIAVEALRCRGITAVVSHRAESPELHDVHLQRKTTPDGDTHVSIVIPTKNAGDLVRKCVTSLRATAGYADYDITIINHDSDDPVLLDFLGAEDAAGRLRVFPYSGPFNYAAMNNAAVRDTSGEFILLLNNDVDGFSPGWLDAMVATMQVDERVGAVGCLLYYPDGDIQHAGVILTAKRPCIAAHAGLPHDSLGYQGRIRSLQEFSAVTAAMMLLRRTAFDAINGFDEVFPDDYNDIDLCLRLREAGFWIVYNPAVHANHWESRTRSVKETAKAVYLKRWRHAFPRDPFYSPHLSTTTFAPDAFEALWRERKRVALSLMGRSHESTLPDGR